MAPVLLGLPPVAGSLAGLLLPETDRVGSAVLAGGRVLLEGTDVDDDDGAEEAVDVVVVALESVVVVAAAALGVT